MKIYGLLLFVVTQIGFAQIPSPRASFIGENPGECFTCSGVATADINGDLVQDLVMGAPGYDLGGVENAGRIYVFFGRNFSGNIPVSTANLIIDGVTENTGLGHAGILCCDVDGDSLYDILTTASEVDCTFIDDLGNPDIMELYRFYIFLGKSIRTQSYLTTAQADGYIQGYFDSQDWRKSIHTIGRYPVSGDFNNDGYDDVMFNARQYLQGMGNNPGESQGYLFYGRPDFAQHFHVVTQRDVLLKNGVDLTGHFTIPLELNAGAGDVNGDGYDDLVMQSFVQPSNDMLPAASVLYGPITQDTVRLDAADVLIVAEPDHYMVYDTSTFDCIQLSDIDGDHVDDILLGRSYYDAQPMTSREGVAYVFYGSDDLPPNLTSDDANVTIEGTVPGFLNGKFGGSMASGDLNHDGQNDLAIWSAGCGEYGKIHLFKGFGYRDTTILDAQADRIFSDCGNLSIKMVPSIIASDITGDGLEELIVGASSNIIDQAIFMVFQNDLITSIESVDRLPSRLDLLQNHPNPFNPSTTISYSIPRRGHVHLRIFNMLGQLVKTLVDRKEIPGEHEIAWNGRNDKGETVSTGLYIYRLQTAGATLSRKMLLIK